MKPRILTFADWYLPGHKGGGSVAAIRNLTELLADDFAFHIITRNHDNGEDRPYAGIRPDCWTPAGKAEICYTADLSFRNIRRHIRAIAPRIIYLNSFFSPFTRKVLLLRRLGLLPHAAVVLAPRGEFSPGALEIRPLRKRAYRKLALFLGLQRNLTWQGSSTLEEHHIRQFIHRRGMTKEENILVASDVYTATLACSPHSVSRPEKRPGSARFVFLSRISPKKNLHFALELLGSVRGQIELDIFGPVEDPAYWRTCQEILRNLPSRVRIAYKGPLLPGQVMQAFEGSHFQLLPTRGENFGYVILESLMAGCPVVTSDQTPWQQLALQGIGWDLPLADRAKWLEALQHCVDMDQPEHSAISERCRSFATEWVSATPFRRSALHLFQTALRGATNSSQPLTAQDSLESGD